MLITADCILGEGGTGILGIESASADIVISGRMKFGPGAQIASVPGGTIRFTGSAFENESTDPAAMAGLANVTMQFEGGPGVVDPFEVAGRDDGPVASAWTENFAVGTLKVGDSGTVGNVRFVDTFDNQPGHEGGEAQYLHSLEIAAGSSLDQNGLNVYVDGGFANAGTLNVTTAGLTVLYTGASPFGAIYADVTSGCNGGTWDGPGITSSAAPAHPQGLAALGVLDDGEKVIVDYTWAGDANLDGVLDSNDYDRIDTAWVLWRAEGIVPEGGFRWAVGDFDYDNTIDSNDYDLIDRAWTLSGGAPLGGNAPVPTPEPATLALLAAGALALLARKRRPAHR